MDIASVYDWFALDSMHAAEQADDPRRREIFHKLADLWAAAAQKCRDEEQMQTSRVTMCNHHPSNVTAQ